MFTILYQDEHLVAIEKPAGWLVHRSWLDRAQTVVVMQTLRDQLGQHVYPVHRLDRPTSGVLLFALSSVVAHQLAEQFANHQVQKVYHAVVRGYLHEAATIDYPLKVELDRIANKFAKTEREAQSAITHYRPLARLEVPLAVGRYATSRYTLLELQPQTGRKHQLRRHLKHIFHPIIGDSKHGDLHQNRAFASYFGLQRLMLHASRLTLRQPISGQLLQLDSPLPEAWLKLFNLP